MKNLKRLGAVVILILTLGVAVSGGEMPTPPCTPGAGEMPTPPCATVQSSDPGETHGPPAAPGETSTPPSDEAYVTEIAASFVLTIVSLF